VKRLILIDEVLMVRNQARELFFGRGKTRNPDVRRRKRFTAVE